MPTTISVADKPTLDDVKTLTTTISGQTTAMGTALGTSGDTISTTTVFGKENKIISDVGDVSTALSTTNSKIGTSSDTADNGTNNQNTIFSKIKYIVSTIYGLNSRLTGNYTTTHANNISNIGSSSNSASATSSTLFGLIKYLVSVGGAGTVKQVQMGTYTTSDITSTNTVTFSGFTVTPSKTVIYIQPGVSQATGSFPLPRVTAINSGSFNVCAYGHASTDASKVFTWQLIEYR